MSSGSVRLRKTIYKDVPPDVVFPFLTDRFVADRGSSRRDDGQ